MITSKEESQKNMDPEQLLARINLKSENITSIDFENLCKLQTAFLDNVPYDNCDIFLDIRSQMNL
jgi:arylamine N-acetyltransferase